VEYEVERNENEKIQKDEKTILLVDDEEDVLDVGSGLLKALGYRVLTARSGKEAVEILREYFGRIDLVLLDMVMPGIGGSETYDRLKEIDPHIKVILSSGYGIDGEATKVLGKGCDGFIQKPFRIRELSRITRDRLSGMETSKDNVH
jgi:two-component system, cell cycle sensor histidine kinase and response regulator CckA